MYKSNVKLITTFIIFVVSFMFIQNIYANSSALFRKDEAADWKVVITSDTKDFKDTHKIKFETRNNPNIVNGKIAPGSIAVATSKIDLSTISEDIILKVKIDNTNNIPDCFKITSKLDGEDYELNTNKIISSEKSELLLTLELEWCNDNDEVDSLIGYSTDTIDVPFSVEVSRLQY